MVEKDLKKAIDEVQKPLPKFSALKVGIVTTASGLFYYYVWMQQFSEVFGQSPIVEFSVLGGTAVAIAIIGRKLKVL